MSLKAIVYSQIQDVSRWNSAVLNTILMHRKSLYTCISNSVGKDLLLLTDVPAMVSLDEAIYSLEYSESLGLPLNTRIHYITSGQESLRTLAVLDGDFHRKREEITSLPVLQQ